MHDTKETLHRRLTAIKNQRSSGELEDLALIIGVHSVTRSLNSCSCRVLSDGKSLTFALDKELSKTFLELAIMCKAVICCEYRRLHVHICEKCDPGRQVVYHRCRRRL